MVDKEKSKGRGRPRQFDRDAALDQAQALFHAHGYEGVGVAALAHAMGINPPSLYAAFGSKLDLFVDVMQRYEQGSTLLAHLDTPGIDTATALTALLHQVASIYPAVPTATGCLVLEGGRSTDPDAASRARACQQRNEAAIRDFVAQSHPDKADVVADYMRVIMSGMSADARAGISTKRLSAIADMAGLALRAMLAGD